MITSVLRTAECQSIYVKCLSMWMSIQMRYGSAPCAKELILIMFGFRLVEGYKFAETSEKKALHIDILHKIYEMEDVKVHG